MNSQVTDRRRQARHPKRTVPELQADGPNQVFTWDITKLPGPVRGQYFDAYVMIDIYSRYIVGAHVHRRESGDLAVEMMKEIFNIHGKPLVIHADGGSSMTSKPVATLLSDLQILQSRSRPHVSNDSVFRGVVQDVQVCSAVPGAVRFAGSGAGIHGRLRRFL